MALTPLPQLAGGLFLSDGSLETSLIYLDGTELPQFAATPVAGFVLASPTWRASAACARHLRTIQDAWLQ